MFRSAALLAVVFALLVLVSGTAYATPLIVNGGFETGSFFGWTLSGNTGSYFYVGSDDPYSGTYALDAGPIGSEGYISQIISLPLWARPTTSLGILRTQQPLMDRLPRINLMPGWAAPITGRG